MMVKVLASSAPAGRQRSYENSRTPINLGSQAPVPLRQLTKSLIRENAGKCISVRSTRGPLQALLRTIQKAEGESKEVSCSASRRILANDLPEAHRMTIGWSKTDLPGSRTKPAPRKMILAAVRYSRRSGSALSWRALGVQLVRACSMLPKLKRIL